MNQMYSTRSNDDGYYSRCILLGNERRRKAQCKLIFRVWRCVGPNSIARGEATEMRTDWFYKFQPDLTGAGVRNAHGSGQLLDDKQCPKQAQLSLLLRKGKKEGNTTPDIAAEKAK
jgi:hypothetical protein